jgi:dTDP-D-glucose 4,6-dehydratase
MFVQQALEDGITETVRWYLDGMAWVNSKGQSLRKLEVGRID